MGSIHPEEGRTLLHRCVIQAGGGCLTGKVDAVKGISADRDLGNLQSDLIIKLQLRIQFENHQLLAGIHPKSMFGGSVFVPVRRYRNRRTWNNSGIIRAQILGNFLHLTAFQWAKGDSVLKINGLHLCRKMPRGNSNPEEKEKHSNVEGTLHQDSE